MPPFPSAFDSDNDSRRMRAAGSPGGGPARGGDPGGSSLDIRTSYDTPDPQRPRKARIIEYASGHVEVTIYSPVGASQRPQAYSPGSDSQGNASRVNRRASVQIRRCALAANLDHLLTLTTRSNVTEYRESKAALDKFLRSMRRAYPGLRYVGCPERQKRGAWHWHILCDRFLPANDVRARWQHYAGEGNIDLKRFHDPLAGARYAAKYITKDIAHAEHKGARYVRSRNIKISTRVTDVATAFRILGRAGWSGEIRIVEGTDAEWAASWL